MTKKIFLYLFFGFIGFLNGRIGHIFGGASVGFHHWIYGLIIMILGFILYKKHFKTGLFIFSFGVGIFISDLKDFLNLQFYNIDTVDKFVFWNID